MSACDWGTIAVGAALFAIVAGCLVVVERGGSGRDNPQL
jgi:hypothetical protein